MSVQILPLDDPTAGAPPDDGAVPADEKTRGAVFTRPSVVEFMLDLVGYTTEADLTGRRLLEPSCGPGSFLLVVARRLLESWRRAGADDAALDDAIRAVELDRATLDATRHKVVSLLMDGGLSGLSAARVAKRWLVGGDFLAVGIEGQFDVVVGNPPYVRQELMRPAKLAWYRATYPTMVGRADLYVAFFERALGLLGPGGKLSFICADAWTRNEYGRELRRLVTSEFALRAYVDMYGLDAFEASVGAYPSITLIERGPAGPVRSARATSTDPEDLARLTRALKEAGEVKSVAAPAPGGAPWLLRGDRRLEAIRQLEDRCPTLEQAGCRVGIGVATGADQVFVGQYDDLPLEDDRKLPLAVNRDIVQGSFAWHGTGVVNPWRPGGGLVDLDDYPKLAAYLEPHRARLAQRHTAKAAPDRRWYKTIDRITDKLTWRPKLLVPDIRGDGDAIAFDQGTVYPHHNLYHITSDVWDLRALQALLRSGLAKLFVEAYAVKLGGGFLRFQAQYLRRIRVPAWRDLAADDQAALQAAGVAGDKAPRQLLERLCGLPAGALGFMEEWR